MQKPRAYSSKKSTKNIKVSGEQVTLASLLKAITPENVHAEISYGASVGKEHW